MAERVVLITGGGSGIGAATARVFADHDYRVIVAGRRISKAARVASTIKTKGGRAEAVSLDVTDSGLIRDVIDMIIGKYRHIDVLVNNAGIAGEARPVHAIPDEEWNELIDVNLNGAFRMSRAVLPHFMKRKKGVIINVSSIAALVGMPNMAAYSAAKNGLIALTRSISVEYGRFGIRCNCVCPGPVVTPMTKEYFSDPDRINTISSMIPLTRPGSAKEIAHIIYFLASDESSFSTGSIITADGGYTAR